MPKLVDHEARRAEIAHATWAALQDVGIERLRLRDIADEVGFSTGVFAHYFRDKDSVLRYAFNLAYERANERIRQSNETETSGVARLRNALVALVPDRKQPDTVAFIATCFGIRSIRDPLLTADYRKKRRVYARLLKSYLHDAIEDGEIRVDGSPDDVLDLIFASLDGVCIAALLNPERSSKTRSTRILETLINRLSVADDREYSVGTRPSRQRRTTGGTR